MVQKLHNLEMNFCKDNEICLRDRVEICFCAGGSSDNSRVPILYTDFSKQKGIIITNGDIGDYYSHDIKALYLGRNNEKFYNEYNNYKNIKLKNYKGDTYKIYKKGNIVKLEPFKYEKKDLKIYVCSSSSGGNNGEGSIRTEIRKRAFTKKNIK